MCNEDIILKAILFDNEAEKVIKSLDKYYEFICPLCGGKAVVIKSSYDNQTSIHCNDCNTSIIQ